MKRLLTVASCRHAPRLRRRRRRARRPAVRAHGGSRIIAVRETATFTSQVDNAPGGPPAGGAFTFTGTLAGQQAGTVDDLVMHIID